MAFDRDDYCACCGRFLSDGMTTGESGLYSPSERFILCEPCWLAEEEHVDHSGTNNHPELVARYAEMLADLLS